MARAGIKELYYITHIRNLPSILEHGILSHEQVRDRQIPFEPIYDEQIVSHRAQRKTPDGKSLWAFANLYIQPRNAMLYRVLAEKSANEIAVIAVRPDILNDVGIFVSTGNAASPLSEILRRQEGLKVVPQLRDDLDREYWNEEDGSKRKMMAECLVPGSIPPDFIQSIFVANRETADRLTKPSSLEIPIIPEPHMFFQPSRRIGLTPNLTVVEGDMFFSRLQTITISVNTVGVMGRGLASRAKYQFPDVYVAYQDLCRNQTLKMGKPFIYKRETSFAHQLADEPNTLQSNEPERWFLLFATKRHWKEKSDIAGIKEGLVWLRENFRKEQIQSLAMPALGCGLGGLEWREVGPLTCKSVVDLGIQVWVYLPTEKRVPDELLTKEFLLGQK